MAATATARKPETRDVGQYDPWNDPVYLQWERLQIEEQEKLAAKAKAQVKAGTPEASQLSQLVSGIDQRKQNFENQGQVNVQQALWQPLSAENMPMQSGVSMGLKSGGNVTVYADQISYDKAAAKDIIAIETGILSMKAQNHASVVIGGRDESFKANAWAYAQLHGLDVQGYVPTPEARALAAQLKSQRQGLNNVGDAPFGTPAGVMRAPGAADLRVVVDNTGANASADAARDAFYNGGPRPGVQPVVAATVADPKDKPAAAAMPVTLNEAQKGQFQQLFAQQVETTNGVPLIQGHHKNMVAAQAAAAGKPDDSPEAAAARKTAGTYQHAFDNRVNQGMDTAVRDLNVNKATRDAFGVETKKALTEHHAQAAEALAKPPQTQAAAAPVTLNEAQKGQFQQLFAQQVETTNGVPLIQGHHKNMVAAQAAAAGKPDDSPEAAAARKTAGTYQHAFDNRVNQGMDTAVRDLNVNKATRDAFGAETRKSLVEHHEAAGKSSNTDAPLVLDTAATHRPGHGGRPNYRAAMPQETASIVTDPSSATRQDAPAKVDAGNAGERIDTRFARRGELTDEQTVQFNRMFGQQVRAINAEKGIKSMREEMFAAQDAANAKGAPADAAEKADKMTRGYQTRFDRNVEESMDVAIKAKNSGLDGQAQAAFAKEVKGALAEYHSLSRDEQATRDMATALAPREPASANGGQQRRSVFPWKMGSNPT